MDGTAWEQAAVSDAVSRGKPVLATIEAARMAAALISGDETAPYTIAEAFLDALLSEYGVPTPSAETKRNLVRAALREFELRNIER